MFGRVWCTDIHINFLKKINQNRIHLGKKIFSESILYSNNALQLSIKFDIVHVHQKIIDLAILPPLVQ